MKNPNIFISYSWDNQAHEDWIMAFANKLRDKGIDANIDKFITQEGTLNLNRMMVEQIKHSDYTIIVMTENYANKADEFSGGVGYETQLLLNYIKDSPNKIIPILRQNGLKANCIPFYLNGFEYIDFSRNGEFDIKLTDLLHKILNINKYDKNPLGDIPELTPKSITIEQLSSRKIKKDLVPSLKKKTDLDKKRFIHNAYRDIIDGINAYSIETQKVNDDFEFEQDNVTTIKSVFSFYVNGSLKRKVKIWLGSLSGLSECVMISYNHSSYGGDSSFNDMIRCEEKGNELILVPTMGIFNQYESDDVDSIIEGIWKQVISYLH